MARTSTKPRPPQPRHPALAALAARGRRLRARFPVISEAFRLAGEADAVDRAAALALFCIFAAVPSLFVAFSAVGFVLGAVDTASGATGLELSVRSRALVRLGQWLREALPGVSWNPAEFANALIEDRATNGIVGTILAVSLGLTVFARIDAAVRAVFGKGQRSALRAAGFMTVFVLLGAFAAVVVTILAPLTEWGLHVASHSVERLSFGWLDAWALLIAGGQVLPVAGAFYFLVRWSAGNVGKRRLAVTALTFGAAWFVGQRLFSLYVSQVVRMDAVYGALTGVVALLMWLFYANIAFMVAVAVLAAWEERALQRRIQPDRPRAHFQGAASAHEASVAHARAASDRAATDSAADEPDAGPAG